MGRERRGERERAIKLIKITSVRIYIYNGSLRESEREIDNG